MARKPRASSSLVADRVLNVSGSSLVDVLDHVVNKGAMATGDLTLGLAGIDLIYLRLSALLCAADRVLPPQPEAPRRRARQPRARKRATTRARSRR